jgi:hypothetical protein
VAMIQTSTVVLSAMFLLVAALGVAYIGQIRQSKSDKQEDRRAIRDAKRERLREAYTQILTTALSLEKLAGVYAWLGGRPEYQKGLDSELNDTMKDLDRELVTLMLESDATEILQMFDEVREAFSRYRLHVVSKTTDPDFSTYRSLGEELEKLKKVVPELIESARKHLAHLETAI